MTAHDLAQHAGNEPRTEYTSQISTYDAGPQGMPIPPILQLFKLRRQQWLDFETLSELQQKKLTAIVNNAYHNVRFYRKVFDSEGIKPADINSIEDMRRIPITERQDLQVHPVGDITAESVDLQKCKKTLTSGSSGRPLTIYRTRPEDNLIDIVWARAFLENGANIWDKNADFHAFQSIPKRWFEHFGIWRRTTIPSLADPMKQIGMLKQAGPDVIRGNPCLLVNLVTIIQRKGIEGIDPRLVFTMGNLLDQDSRALIESVLHTRVFDYYGTTELGCIAWECSEHTGYHINSDSVVIEVINEKGEPARKGERGKLICTGLLSYAMPFIRYNIGDVGILGAKSCPCGRGLPLLEHLEGRAFDFFVSADGTHHSPSLIHNQIKHVPGIQQYRVVQENETSVTAEIVPDKNLSQKTSEELRRIMKRVLGDEAETRVEIVSEIPCDASGKMQAIVSKVKKGF
jgi:phenylacetate-CoA ligase